MRATRAGRGFAALVLLAGCATNPAPNAYAPPADVAAREAYGGWIEVDTTTGRHHGDAGTMSGELIAVAPDSVFVLSGGALVALRRVRSLSGTLWAYDANWGVLALWGTVGAIGSISNGYYAGLTLPLWIVASGFAAGSQSRAPRVEAADSAAWEDLRLYARFPQGLPGGLDRASLRPAGDTKAPASVAP